MGHGKESAHSHLCHLFAAVNGGGHGLEFLGDLQGHACEVGWRCNVWRQVHQVSRPVHPHGDCFRSMNGLLESREPSPIQFHDGYRFQFASFRIFFRLLVRIEAIQAQQDSLGGRRGCLCVVHPSGSTAVDYSRHPLDSQIASPGSRDGCCLADGLEVEIFPLPEPHDQHSLRRDRIPCVEEGGLQALALEIPHPNDLGDSAIERFVHGSGGSGRRGYSLEQVDDYQIRIHSIDATLHSSNFGHVTSFSVTVKIGTSCSERAFARVLNGSLDAGRVRACFRVAPQRNALLKREENLSG